MRRIVFQMMTTLNGRLDDPMAWVHSVSDDQYAEIERIHAAFDTVLVGRTTYEEMAAYWPGALSETVGTPANRTMARRMHEYRKLVFSRDGRQAPSEWNNAELAVAPTADALKRYLMDLKAQAGGDIHLSGGSRFARAVIGLGLVDAFHFFIYPVVSDGAPWHGEMSGDLNLQLVDAKGFENGVVALHYLCAQPETARPQPRDFTDMLA